MRLAIFGGTFNPVHVGHLFLAEEVRTQLGYERLLFVPANIPVHKNMEIEVGAAHRLAMLKIAVISYPDIQVDDCELRRGGNSYTIDTVRDIQERYCIDSKPGLIIGDDLAEGFDTWKEAKALAQMVELIVAHRRSTKRVPLRYPCRYIENSLLPVSSSEIRERLRRRLPVRNLVPERVIRYIRRHGLYTEQA